MKTRNPHYFLIILLFLIASLQYTFAQEKATTTEKIATVLDNYFVQERENIHLHLNKDVFLTNESIRFKGYVFERKVNIPFLYTTNVFAVLIDQHGNKVAEKLLFASNGIFAGHFALNEKYQSGVYYIQLYTNWMNNFAEDESALYKVSIINENTPVLTKYAAPNLSQINIELYPEGGNFVLGVANNVGVKISDCNGNPVPLGEGLLVDSQGNGERKVFINKFGVGKFDFVPDGLPYKLRFNNNGNMVEASLPTVQMNGLALEVNNFAVTNRTIVKIRTTKDFIATLDPAKKVILLIHQDNKATYVDIDFSTQQTNYEFILSNDDLFPGVNMVRVIDSNLKQLAERIIFNYPSQKSEVSMTVNRKAGNLVFSGQTSLKASNLSISVLPEKTMATFQQYDIYGSLLIDPYLNQKIPNARYYLEAYSKSKHYELDLFLLNQKNSKFNWPNMVSNPPQMTHEFDTGLTIEGKLTKPISNPGKHKVRAYSFVFRVSMFSDLNENMEFQFKNLVLADSSILNFGLIKMPDMNTVLDIKAFSKVTNARRSFNKIYKPQFNTCNSISEDIVLELPKFLKNTVLLDQVDIKAPSKHELSRKNDYGNINLRGEKIGDLYTGMDLIDYIRNKGFNVIIDMGQLFIYGRSSISFQGQVSPPAVFIDQSQIMTFDQLRGMKMQDIDEIYLNTHAMVPQVRGAVGVIRIYLKKDRVNSNPRALSKTFMVEKGFASIMPFENTKYASTNDKGFENFGVLHWDPSVLVDETGSFSFEVPDIGHKSIKVLIEGMSVDGKMISEIQTIHLN